MANSGILPRLLNAATFGRLTATTRTSRFIARKLSNESSASHSEEETEKFSMLAQCWWDVHGEMKALHSMNEVRVPFIRDCILYQGYGESKLFCSSPLQGVDILDVGCGGGILSEPLARLGANVVGIDSSEEAIEVAKQHRSPSMTNLQYLVALAEDMASVGSIRFDVVVASEVIEHVPSQQAFVETCASLVRPGGSFIISTVNRTLLSDLLVIKAAESVLGVVSKGVHDWNKFVTVEELTSHFEAGKCSVRKIHGLFYNPICDTWSFVGNKDMNYIVHAIKETD